MPTLNITTARLLQEAADLLSVEGDNTEYDRAIVELTMSLLGLSSDDVDKRSMDALLRTF